MNRFWRLSLGSMLVAVACGGEFDEIFPERDGGDEDSFVDGDGDADGDADADADMDADIDADADADAGDGGPPVGADRAEVVGVCFDGETQDARAGLFDCEDIECLLSGFCCQETDRSWVQGDFDICTDPEDCGWSTFGVGYDVAPVSEGRVLLGDAYTGEVGLCTPPLSGLNGEPTLSFRGSLDPATCPETSCRQVVGVAFSAQDTISAGTGVVPRVGLVLDGELEAVHLFVGGRLDRSIPMSREQLARDLGYGFRVQRDGRVAFWVGLEPDPEDTSVVLTGLPQLSATLLDTQGQALRIVMFARIEGEGAGQVGMVRLDRPICDTPGGFQRESSPVVRADSAERRVGRPAVLRRPEREDLLMVHERDNGLAVTTSHDGTSWIRFEGQFFDIPPDTQYGVVARRAPAVVFWGSDSGNETYHLWFEGESEYRGEAFGEGPTYAIVHATSDDEGLTWVVEESEPIALIGTSVIPWRTEVGEPTVAIMDDGRLMMLFVGRNPATGATRLGRAHSEDGKFWAVDAEPLSFDDDSPLGFERDGVSQPALIRRGGVFHLWYVGYDGARATIGYAVGQQNVDGPRWTWIRAGSVLEPTQRWERLRVTGPALLTLPPVFDDAYSGSTMGVLTMWYVAGRLGSEEIGVAYREIPTVVEEFGF